MHKLVEPSDVLTRRLRMTSTAQIQDYTRWKIIFCSNTGDPEHQCTYLHIHRYTVTDFKLRLHYLQFILNQIQTCSPLLAATYSFLSTNKPQVIISDNQACIYVNNTLNISNVLLHVVFLPLTDANRNVMFLIQALSLLFCVLLKGTFAKYFCTVVPVLGRNR